VIENLIYNFIINLYLKKDFIIYLKFAYINILTKFLTEKFILKLFTKNPNKPINNESLTPFSNNNSKILCCIDLI
jgi:hypothetical protein